MIGIISLVSCDSDCQNGKCKLISFDNHDACEISIKYKFLELPGNVTINVINQVLYNDGKLYLLSSGSKPSAIYVFDYTSGRYLASIGQIGRGPGEYLFPSSMTIYRNVLNVVDKGQNVILQYDLHSFELLDSKSSPDIMGLEYDSNNSLFANPISLGESNYCNDAFALLNDQYVIQDTFVNKPLTSGYITGPAKPFYNYEGNVYAYTQYDPTIYKLCSSGVESMYTISYDGLKFPDKSYLKQISAGNEDYTTQLFDSNYISYFNFHETESNLCSMCIAKNKRYIGLYDKSDKKGYLIPENGFSDYFPTDYVNVSGVVDGMFAFAFSISDIDNVDSFPELTCAADNGVILGLFNLAL